MNLITSKDNKIVKLISKLNKSSKERKEKSLFIAEGKRIVREAVFSAYSVEFICVSQTFYNENNDEISLYLEKSIEIYVIKDNIFNSICDTKTPQGVLAAIKTLDKNIAFDKMNYNGKYILLENLQNPDNIGTIIRTADAFSIDGIILTKGCCDIYSPKVVRGTMGSIFRVPVFNEVEAVSFVNNFNGVTYASVLDKNAVTVNKSDFSGNVLVCIGNEGKGLDKETIKSCDKSLYIPMKGNAESLNASVASSIIMWEMTK
ncbi:MAG: TrmH family RNA methyltransferase [Acutalibacteraceae bacterium]